ncbi:HAD-IA family hydrolase [Candidatus Uhrbacteria bacterium]|nr:HAD-IA family hydrolase [Candidatus Uhrbacteria bacterium]
MEDNPRAFIFDVDGTLIDTEQYIVSAFQHVIAQNNLEYQDSTRLRSLIGMPLEQIYKLLAGNFHSTDEIEHLCGQHVDFQKEKVHLVREYPQVRETLAHLHSRGVPMGIFTSRRSPSVRPTLQQAGIDSFFDVIITGEQVQNGKPHPEGLLKALSQLQVAPSEAFMIGDTDLDIMVGKNASAKTIGVSWGMRGRDVYNYDADYVIDSMDQLISLVIPKTRP